MSEKRVQVVISGRVQGVGFRASCQREAERLNVTGWVRNRWDGNVEALFEGPAGAVDAMLRWCRQGPLGAWVEDVQVTEAPSGPPNSGFHVRSSSADD